MGWLAYVWHIEFWLMYPLIIDSEVFSDSNWVQDLYIGYLISSFSLLFLGHIILCCCAQGFLPVLCYGATPCSVLQRTEVKGKAGHTKHLSNLFLCEWLVYFT